MEQPNPRVAAARPIAARFARAVPALPIRRWPAAWDGPVSRAGEA